MPATEGKLLIKYMNIFTMVGWEYIVVIGTTDR
jgi:hypothetical protein